MSEQFNNNLKSKNKIQVPHERKRDIFLSESSLSHLTLVISSFIHFLKMKWFVLLYGWVIIHCLYIHFCIHLSTWVPVDDSATINMGAQVSLLYADFDSFSYISRSGSYGTSVFNFLSFLIHKTRLIWSQRWQRDFTPCAKSNPCQWLLWGLAWDDWGCTLVKHLQKNKTKSVYVCARVIYYKVLVHMIMEFEKSYHLPSISWRPRKLSTIVWRPVSWQAGGVDSSLSLKDGGPGTLRAGDPYSPQTGRQGEGESSTPPSFYSSLFWKHSPRHVIFHQVAGHPTSPSSWRIKLTIKDYI
jgi:hypothetical protein